MHAVMQLLSGRRFRPTLLWTLVATAAIAGTIMLGHWQFDRAQQKAAAAARYDDARSATPMVVTGALLDGARSEHRRLQARGRFDPKHAILLDNRVRHGVVGFEVVMPLATGEGTRRLLVNRGWIAGTGSRQRLPEVLTPETEVFVSGFAAVPGKKMLELGTDVVDGRIWQNLTIDRYVQRTGLDVQPVVLMQENDLGDGLAREWPRPDFGINTHRSYAFQWFAMAVLVLVVYVALSLRRVADQS